ncbi:C6 transcription factor [Colletotrichum asianum]|uniref:C6 transcription factor n=1 Tax=Colletotrichum asianum TaxID=702518 RepID=A0A8H3ZNN8_9PEZI|nr:C6 transcription factor [Colletotrichum asianum]
MSEFRQQASNDGSPAIIASRRLPTRVSNACNRCRRNKNRCDAFRPCSLCVRANVDCEQASLDEHPKGRPQSRSERRKSKLRKRPQATNPLNARSATSLPAQQTLSPREDGMAGTIEDDYVAESITQHGSWPSLDYGESESAMGIARKVMDQRSLAAVQTLILLGSHHVYHGRPNLSFALLGATIKMSHALGLHRRQKDGSFDDIEERKRVWWTIYTWDRFASISYGRPLSINDEDYNVDLPAKFTESPLCGSNSPQAQVAGVCYSPYQTELTQLYLIASPALKKIFGSLSARTTCQYFDSEHRSLVTNVIQRLASWRRHLPPELRLDLKRDYDPSTTGWSVRAHLLQSLSLQLTFDNLLIVLHRPFLARQLENLSLSSPGPNSSSVAEMISPSASHGSPQSLASQGSVHSPHENQELCIEQTAISGQWWDAAVRTASVTELPQLTQLATESHLVAFVAMNMFNAAIVLILVALSNPLSDQAQGIKRPITKVFRLEEFLGQRSSLSSQSSAVLKNLIRLLLRREGEAMIGTAASNSTITDTVAAPRPLLDLDPRSSMSERESHTQSESVINILVHGPDQGHGSNPSFAQRLNESLASVQQIIPPFQNEYLEPGLASESRGDGALLGGQSQHISYAAGSAYQGPTESPGQHAVDYGANGLFWLWDSTWSGQVP